MLHVETISHADLASRLARQDYRQAGPSGRSCPPDRVQAWDKLAAFVGAADAAELDLSDAVAVLDGDCRVAWACLAVRSAGRTCLMVTAPVPAWPDEVAAAARAVGRLVDIEARHGTCLVQALLPPWQRAEGRMLLGCGFVHLAELIYMRADLSADSSGAGDRAEPWPDGDVVAYQPALEDRFAAVLQASYVHTLDCPGLEGLRRMEDVLASHRSSGRFLPDQWLLYCQGGEPIGATLVNEVPDEAGEVVELVYMGLTESARGRGLGRRMLSHAMARAAKRGYQRMLLAVDSRNEPAIRLYRRAGFVETIRRVAYVLATGADRSGSVPQSASGRG